jgi:SPP1 family phage portal protein
MLSGSGRFGFDSNAVFKMPADVFKTVRKDDAEFSKCIANFLTQHYNRQIARIVELERYYVGDNNIHYWLSHKSPKRSDNRIANGMPAYITNLRVGYSFGNQPRFQYNQDDDDSNTAGDDLISAIDDFNTKTDEPYHEKVMKKRLSVTGRAYELLYVRKATNDLAIKALEPANTFVVYDTTVEQHSLFAVYYYPVTYMDNTTWYVNVYTDDMIYHYAPVAAPTVALESVAKKEAHYFDCVPITEYVNNDERMGDWERSLDYFDSYDKALSEMANSQEDFNNATLVITGDVETDDSGKPDVDRKSSIIWLKPKEITGANGSITVVTPTANFLTKQLPAADWQQYVDHLSDDLHKYTNTPDVNSENFASNASGVAMSYKLWGSDQERATQESLYLRGIMRRLRMMATYWTKYGKIGADDVEKIKVIFTPNLPKNDAAIVANVRDLSGTGEFSAETLRQMAESVTGVKPDAEAARVEDEDAKDPNKITLPYDVTKQPDDQQATDDQGSDSAGKQPSPGVDDE